MKVYICADIEGVSGVVRMEHSRPEGREYARAREQMTREVNAAIAGACAAGATEIMVADSHNVGINLVPELLDERARLVMGTPRPLGMMPGIEEGFGRVFFVGAHAMAGTPNASMVHIYHGRVQRVLVNGLAVGEIGLNALMAGHCDVPVALVTGDSAACAEATALLGNGVVTAAVKQSVGAYAATCVHPDMACALIEEAAKRAMAARVKPLCTIEPVRLEATFTTSSAADRMERIPGLERLDGRTVAYNAANYTDAHKAMLLMADLLELVHFI